MNFHQITIHGEPAAGLRIVEHDRGDTPPPDWLSAAFPSSGIIRVLLPSSPAGWVLLSTGKTEHLRLSGDPDASGVTVDLR